MPVPSGTATRSSHRAERAEHPERIALERQGRAARRPPAVRRGQRKETPNANQPAKVDLDGYEVLVKAGEIQQAPAGTDADYFILTFARELDAVLSNDRFEDRIASFPEVRNRIIRYMIVADEVVLERRTKRRAR